MERRNSLAGSRLRQRSLMTQSARTRPRWCHFRASASFGVLAGGALVICATLAVGGAVGERRVTPREPVESLSSPRVIVIKAKRTMHLLDGDRLVRTYPIDLGTDPVGPKRRKGDGRTPVGVFHVIAKNTDSPYHRFIGLDYPDLATADWGLFNGLISAGEALSIRRALAAGRCPDWSTALGGGIGIHGRRIGQGWTAGCIALSDGQVEELFSVLRIGDRVEILP